MTWLTRTVLVLALLVPSAADAQPRCADSASLRGIHLMPASVGMASVDDGSEVLSITGTALRALQAGQYLLLDTDGVVAEVRLTRQNRESHQGRFVAEFEATTPLAREAREGAITNERHYHHVVVGPFPRGAARARLLFAGVARAGSAASATPDSSPRLTEGTFDYAVDLDGDGAPDLSFLERRTDARSATPHINDVSHVASTAHYACGAWRASDQLTWATQDLIGP